MGLRASIHLSLTRTLIYLIQTISSNHIAKNLSWHLVILFTNLGLIRWILRSIMLCKQNHKIPGQSSSTGTNFLILLSIQQQLYMTMKLSFQMKNLFFLFDFIIFNYLILFNFYWIIKYIYIINKNIFSPFLLSLLVGLIQE